MVRSMNENYNFVISADNTIKGIIKMPNYFSFPKHHFSKERQILCSCATKDRIVWHTRLGSSNPIVFCRNCGGTFYQSIVDNYFASDQFVENDHQLLAMAGKESFLEPNAQEIQEKYKNITRNKRSYYGS